MKPEDIKSRINDLAKEKRPFLFGVNFELSEGFFLENPLSQREILFRTPLGSNSKEMDLAHVSKSKLQIFPEPYLSYRKKFDIVMDSLKRGDSYLINLTVKTPIESTLSLKEIFEQSMAPYSLYVPDKFVCFSPERFVHISDGMISTNPMKGTISADIFDAEKMILTDKKETAEHNTIVDLLRNDLGKVSNNVKVLRFRYIDRIRTKHRDIFQVSSEIRGDLCEDGMSHMGDVIFGMLPAGSVSGAPKCSTIKIIKDAEKESRGYYTGIFGYFNGTEFDSGVMIRFIEESGGKKYFRSGGGITVFSDPRKEYDEVIEKIYLPFL